MGFYQRRRKHLTSLFKILRPRRVNAVRTQEFGDSIILPDGLTTEVITFSVDFLIPMELGLLRPPVGRTEERMLIYRVPNSCLARRRNHKIQCGDCRHGIESGATELRPLEQSNYLLTLIDSRFIQTSEGFHVSTQICYESAGKDGFRQTGVDFRILDQRTITVPCPFSTQQEVSAITDGVFLILPCVATGKGNER